MYFDYKKLKQNKLYYFVILPCGEGRKFYLKFR